MSSHKKLFLKASLIISVAVILSRVLGMVREQYTLYLFGAGWELDAFISASKIPSALRNLLGEGAFSAVFVALFSGIWSKDRQEGIRFANQVISLLMVLSLAVTLLGIAAASFYLPLIHKSSVNFEAVISLTYFIMPFLPFISLAAIAMGILNCWEVYFIPALAPLFGNIIFLITAFFLAPHYGIVSLAIAFLAASVVDFAVQLPSLFKRGFRFRWNLKIDEPIRQFFKSFLPVAFGMAVFQINRIVSNIFSSSIEGGNTVFEKSFIITQLVLSVFITGISTVTLPLIAKENEEKRKLIYIDSLRMIFMIILPFSVFFALLGEEIASWIYKDLLIFLGIGAGKVSMKVIHDMGQMLVYFAPGILFFGLITLINRGFQGLKKFYYPVLGSAISVIANYFLMSNLLPLLGIQALPLAISISSFLNFLILFLMFKHLTSVSYQAFYLTAAKSLIASGALFAWVWLAKIVPLPVLLKVPLICLSGLIIYLGSLFLLKEQELRSVASALRKILPAGRKKAPTK